MWEGFFMNKFPRFDELSKFKLTSFRVGDYSENKPEIRINCFLGKNGFNMIHRCIYVYNMYLNSKYVKPRFLHQD